MNNIVHQLMQPDNSTKQTVVDATCQKHKTITQAIGQQQKNS
jgi:hypothetical protein